MAALAILLLTITISGVVVKIAGVALRMTGMPEKSAQFQALSAFTGTGFTTREAERIMAHHRRRRIVRFLMILGNAGLATVIASAIATFSATETTSESLVRAATLASLLVLFYWLAVEKRLNRWLDIYIASRLEKYTDLDLADFEEVLVLDRKSGIASIDVHEDNPIIGLPIRDLGLSALKVLILAIERRSGLISTPGPDTRIQVHDRLVCYGNTKLMKEISQEGFKPVPHSATPFEEMLRLDDTYGVSSVTVPEGARIAGHSLRTLGLTRSKVLVLAVIRAEEFLPSPPAETILSAGDRLVCYGPQLAIRSIVDDGPAATLMGVGHSSRPPGS